MQVLSCVAPVLRSGRALGRASLFALLALSLGACAGHDDPGGNASSTGAPKGSSKNKNKNKSKDAGGTSGGKKKKQPKGKDKGEDQDPGEKDGAQGAKFDMGAMPEPKSKSDGSGYCPIDFLFVIDNSGSMASEQTNLAKSVPKFIESIKKATNVPEDFHIGVTSTDIYSANTAPECKKKIGGLVTQVEMATDPMQKNPPPPKECGPYQTKKRFMSEKDDLSKTFTCAAKLGIIGYGMERPMDSMRNAISKEMTAPGACNDGFLRDGALLVVVVITDEEDSMKEHLPGIQSGSRGEPADWHKALIDAKGGDARRVVVLGLLGTPAPNECKVLMKPDEVFVKADGAQLSPRLIDFVKRFGKRGVVGDVCAPDYGAFFESALDTIGKACEELPPG